MKLNIQVADGMIEFTEDTSVILEQLEGDLTFKEARPETEPGTYECWSYFFDGERMRDVQVVLRRKQDLTLRSLCMRSMREESSSKIHPAVFDMIAPTLWPPKWTMAAYIMD